MKTIDMEIAIARYFDYRQNLIVPNVSWGLLNHECDILVLTPSGYATEIEIKISKSDLLADKKKKHDHYSPKIKYLYFAISENIDSAFALENIPERAGLLFVYMDAYGFTRVKKIRPAERNTTAKQFTIEDRYQLARLGTMRIWPMKRTIKNYSNGNYSK